MPETNPADPGNHMTGQNKRTQSRRRERGSASLIEDIDHINHVPSQPRMGYPVR